MRASQDYRITFVGNIESSANDNIDVFVHFADGTSFVATFFTLLNIESLMKKYAATGESGSGKYFWAASMILVEVLDEEYIRCAVDDLLESGLFHGAFEAVY